MPSFANLWNSIRAHDGALSLDLPDDWAQGRTAYGGLTAALCAEAAARAFPGLPPLRSAQFAFAGPASGTLAARASLVRQGRSAATVEATLDGAAGPATRALLTYGAARASRTTHDRADRAALPDPSAADAFFPTGIGPAFAANFDMRLAAGARPMAAADPEFAIWARHHDAAGTDPVVALIALADAPPPAAMLAFDTPAPISTMTWTLDLAAVPADPNAWVLLRTASLHAAEGYSAQRTIMTAEDGALIGSASQTVALFG